VARKKKRRCKTAAPLRIVQLVDRPEAAATLVLRIDGEAVTTTAQTLVCLVIHILVDEVDAAVPEAELGPLGML
jgi:hypothetical protein